MTVANHAVTSVYPTIRRLLFHLDAERAHELVFTLFQTLEAAISRSGKRAQPWTHPTLEQNLWGCTFLNPVGLAAGFDKSARAPHVWPLFNFGFAELGTVTAHAQPGNSRPRMFRLPNDQALINRLGFNNDGATAVAERLRRARARCPWPTPIGINLGKSRVTALDDAVGDYLGSFRQLFLFGDYFVINVSSPNTPGLRDLQQEEQLAALASSLSAENVKLAAQAGRAPAPLLIKLAPDLADDALPAVVNVARQCGIAGFVATNTTISRAGLTTPSGESGGLSGRPLTQRSTEVIRVLRRLSGAEMPIIGVGGIFSAEDAYAKIRAGASLVQIYTAFIYEGPGLPRRIAQGLVSLLERDGFKHLRDAVGVDA